MICNKCGESNIENAETCSKCGAELIQETVIQEQDGLQENLEESTFDTNENSEIDSIINVEDGLYAEMYEEDEISEESQKKSIIRIFFKKFWKIVVVSVLAVLLVLVAIFYKPVFYSTTFTASKIANNFNKSMALGLAETAYKFKNTNESRDFINNTCLDVSQELINTDIPKAIEVASDGYNLTASNLLKAVMEDAKALNDYAKKNGSAYVGSVDGQKITISEFKVFLYSVKYQILQNAGLPNTADAAKAFWDSMMADGTTTVAEYAKEQALTNLQQFKIQLIKAKERGSVLDATSVNTEFLTIDSQVQQQFGEGDTGLKGFLNEVGVSVEQFKNVRMEELLTADFYQSEIESINAETDAQRKIDYEKSRDNIDSVTVTHVLFLTSDITTGKAYSEKKQEAAKKKAEDVLAQVKAGADITKLAIAESEDPGVKENKGEYTFKNGEMVVEFGNWAFKAKVGDVGIVKTEFGYHVIELKKRTDYKEAAKDDIAKGILIYKMTQWEKDKKYEVIKDKTALDKISLG